MIHPDDTNISIVGKLDQIVYYYIDGEQYQRAYFIPVQPGTPEQLAWWAVFRQGVLNWQAFSASVKDTYNSRAKRYQMSGFNLYMREYLKSQA